LPKVVVWGFADVVNEEIYIQELTFSRSLSAYKKPENPQICAICIRSFTHISNALFFISCYGILWGKCSF